MTQRNGENMEKIKDKTMKRDPIERHNTDFINNIYPTAYCLPKDVLKLEEELELVKKTQSEWRMMALMYEAENEDIKRQCKELEGQRDELYSMLDAVWVFIPHVKVKRNITALLARIKDGD